MCYLLYRSGVTGVKRHLNATNMPMSKQTQEKVASVTLVKSCGNIDGRTNTRGQDGIIGRHLCLAMMCSSLVACCNPTNRNPSLKSKKDKRNSLS